jgi:carbon-monoxide dehydrogenase medium subunit
VGPGGRPASAENLLAAAEACRDGCHPQSDQRGPEDYKRHLVGELVRRGLLTAVARAQGREA